MVTKKKEKTINPLQDYTERGVHNEETFRMLVKNLRPDIFVLMDLLDNTGINPYVLFHIIRHLNNIAIGTKYGEVVTTIENGKVTYVSGKETTRLEEMVKKY